MKHIAMTTSHRRGFTLMELIVAIALVGLMMFLINQVFNQTRQAISRGVGTGDIIANSKAISSQLRLDAQQMVGPHDNNGLQPEQSGGVLIIIQHLVGDWDRNGALDGDTDGNGAVQPWTGEVYSDEGVPFDRQNARREWRLVRSDQVSFIRKRKPGQYPLTPGDTDTFTSYDDGGLARFTRVWYGHVLRTNPNGTDALPGGVDDPEASGAMGQPGINEDGWRFIVGRQELFLGEVEDAAAGKTLPATAADGAWWDSTANAYSGTYQGPMPTQQLYMGLTDYANFSLDDAGIFGGSSHPEGAVVGGDAADAVYSTAAGASRRLWSSLSDTDYRDQAYWHAYPAKRLRVNPEPEDATPKDPDDDLRAWQLAQMHPYLMEYVSDFAIEFTADLTLDGKMDTLMAAVSGTDDLGRTFSYPEGMLIWYTHPLLANYPGGGFFDSTKPVTYPYVNPTGSGAATIFTDTRLGPTYLPNGYGVFVWRHDDEAGIRTGGDAEQPSHWPYLLRFRWRMHDPRGQIDSGAGHHGMWFEQIVKVNRPQATP